ncbi:hypothetical protein [Pedobacter panaciterrae]
MDADDPNKYHLELPITYTGKDARQKNIDGNSVRFARIFDTTLDDYSFKYLDAEEEGALNDDKQIFLSDLKRGIIFNENNVTIKLKNGSIQTSTG